MDVSSFVVGTLDTKQVGLVEIYLLWHVPSFTFFFVVCKVSLLTIRRASHNYGMRDSTGTREPVNQYPLKILTAAMNFPYTCQRSWAAFEMLLISDSNSRSDFFLSGVTKYLLWQQTPILIQQNRDATHCPYVHKSKTSCITANLWTAYAPHRKLCLMRPEIITTPPTSPSRMWHVRRKRRPSSILSLSLLSPWRRLERELALFGRGQNAAF